MTTVVTPVNVINWPALSIPADGEAVNSASVLLYIQEIANRLESLRQRLPGANPSANRISLPYSLAITPSIAAAAWTAQGLGNGAQTYQNATLAGLMLIPLSAILNNSNGKIIKSMNVLYVGATGHAALPAVMPKFELVKLPRGVGGLITAITSGSITVIETMNDASGTTAAFQNIHFVSKDLVTPELYDNSQAYYLRVTAESGANALVGASVIDNGFIEVSGY